MARNLTDSVDGFLRNATYLIHDRDPLFTAAFRDILKDRGVRCARIPAQSPNCNPHAERFVKTIKYECLHHFVFFGERHLRYVTDEAGRSGRVVCRSRLGGMLNFYHREAA